MLKPIQDVRLILPSDLERLVVAGDLHPSQIGWKAFGLASLPRGWTPRFLVLSSSYLETEFSEDELRVLINNFFRSVDSQTVDRLYVRSNGTKETIEDRGQFESRHCRLEDLASTVKALHAGLPTESRKEVHWIVQEYVEPIELGHLSNERHLKKEGRDWLVDFEAKELDAREAVRMREPVPIGIRRWRDGALNPDLDLNCGSEFGITITLRNIAKWAMQYDFRIHFEWVWDGKRLYVVQAEAQHNVTGTNPYDLFPAEIDKLEPTALRIFREATGSDYRLLRKLKNAKIYAEIGFEMPVFFVAHLKDYLESILAGKMPVELDHDLEILTRRPLVIRTDGTNIPSEKREMLPRSDELRSCREARAWILNSFSSLIEKGGLIDYDLMFIGHQFIPSVASAWARAEPGHRIVRIESLWGIPEGLYYFAHDTFEVDTKNVDLQMRSRGARPKFGIKKRLRYKGRFIGPDSEGRWVPYRTAPPDDWKSSVRRNDWLCEIAETTRLVAEVERHAVCVMWFIDNHKDATKHSVLPWFHSECDIQTARAAPRQKYSKSRRFELRTSKDWHSFRQKVESGIIFERVILRPTDPEIIRNADFAKDLGKLAKKHEIVIELSGGVLSHAYYLLQKSGAKVEVRDLFGNEEDVDEFNKVVRDRIPEVIESGGEEVETITLQGDALVVALQRKLVEEAFEALDAKSGEALLGELADIEEVLRSVCAVLNISREELEQIRVGKARKRGSFEKGLMLTRTITPHSIPRRQNEDQKDEVEGDSYPTIISDPLQLPLRRPYRRPDLRTIDDQPEKMLTFEVDLTELSEGKQVLSFSMPVDGKNRSFVLSVDIDRKTSRLRETVSLRLEPVQLELEFGDQ